MYPVYLGIPVSARNVQRGRAAVDQLNKEGFRPKFYQLETTKLSSIEEAKKFVESNYGGLDLLINNAGMLYRVGTKTVDTLKPGDAYMRQWAVIIVSGYGLSPVWYQAITWKCWLSFGTPWTILNDILIKMKKKTLFKCT